MFNQVNSEKVGFIVKKYPEKKTKSVRITVYFRYFSFYGCERNRGGQLFATKTLQIYKKITNKKTRKA